MKLCLCLVLVTAAAFGQVPATCNFDGEVLAMRKKQIAAGEASIADDVKKLRTDADKELRRKIVTITEDKKHVAPGGDPHDYVSIGTYYWPNPATSNAMNYAAGFSGLSFNYSLAGNSPTYASTVDIWSGLNGTGALLDTLSLTAAATSVVTRSTGITVATTTHPFD